jgi:hypothetical protein
VESPALLLPLPLLLLPVNMMMLILVSPRHGPMRYSL